MRRNLYDLGDILYEVDLETFEAKEFIVAKIIIQAPEKNEEINKSGVVYIALDGHALYEELLLPNENAAKVLIKLIKEDVTKEG